MCHDGAGYVFVEVKTRRDGSFVSAVESLGPRKLARLERLAQSWLALKGRRAAAWRIALVALTVRASGTEVQMIDVD